MARSLQIAPFAPGCSPARRRRSVPTGGARAIKATSHLDKGRLQGTFGRRQSTPTPALRATPPTEGIFKGISYASLPVTPIEATSPLGQGGTSGGFSRNPTDARASRPPSGAPSTEGTL